MNRPILLASFTILIITILGTLFIVGRVSKKNYGFEKDPLTIDYLRAQTYPGSNLLNEKEHPAGENFKKYTVSYLSEGIKVNALMAIPTTSRPTKGFPVIVIAHGDVPTKTYVPTEKYVNQVELFASNGYIVLMPDYRGHAQSEGKAKNAYAFPDYIVDLLNAIHSVKRHPAANPHSIGLWSHSTGGHIALRAMVVENDIKAGVFWGGVVGSFQELLDNWPTYWEYTNQPAPKPDPNNPDKDWRAFLTSKYGSPKDNPEGWRAISATSYLDDINAPVQLHHSLTDEWVPYVLSKMLHNKLKAIGKPSELLTYENDNHNLEKNNRLAMERTIAFFDRHLKSR